VVGGVEFIKNISDIKSTVWHENTNIATLDSVDRRLLTIIRELDR
jgi:hypothetical protein